MYNFSFISDHTYCKRLERKKRVKRKVRLAVTQRRNLPQFIHRRNDVVKNNKEKSM